MVNSRSIILLNFTHTIQFHVEHEMLQEIQHIYHRKSTTELVFL